MKGLLLAVFASVASVVFAEGNLAKPKWRTEILVPGVTVFSADVDDPKTLRLNAVKVDLKTPGLFFTGTGKCPGYGQPLEEAKSIRNKKGEKIEPSVKRTALEKTSAFFERCSRPAESGGRGLDMLVAFGSSQNGQPYSNGYACPEGLVISDGVVVSDVSRGRGASLVVRKDGTVDFVRKLSPGEYGSIAFARSGYTMIREGGKDIAPEGGTFRGRLAAGLSADRRYLYIITADTGDVTRAASDGVDYHELNTLFEGFGVADAVAYSFGRGCELIVKDRKNPSGRVLNGYDGESPMVHVNTGIYRVDPKAAQAATEARQKAECPVTAKFQSPRLYAVKIGPAKHVGLKGQVKVKFESELERFKRPSLNVVSIFDIDGMWYYCDVFVREPKTSAGECLQRGRRAEASSMALSEVAADQWENVTFGNSRSAFYSAYNIPEKAKLLMYRLEVWQNGKIIAVHESDPKLPKKLGFPDEWYVKGKYPDKITYRYPPPPKK